MLIIPDGFTSQRLYTLGFSAILVILVTGVALWWRERRRKDEFEWRARQDEAKRIELEREFEWRARQDEREVKRIERERESEWRAKQEEREAKRIELEERRIKLEEDARYDVNRREEDKIAASSAGPGSGGYIVVDMSEKERPLFHDLLKGFEDYAKLNGYHINFSIDSTFEGKIAFKFTLPNDGFVVGPERVRQDFKEYVDQVRNKGIEDLDNLPVITSFEEHNLLVALLKNRISFLQHSYTLSTNAVSYYESLILNVRTFPALPVPSVVVHTGGSMDSRSYSAVNSQKVLQGDNNSLTDNSINIGRSFNERQERIAAVDDLIGKLKTSETEDEGTAKAERSLSKVRDELADEAEPSTFAVKKWLEAAKSSLGTAALGYEVVEAGRKLWEMFGLT